MTRSLYADDGEAPPVTFCVRNVLGAPVAGVSVTVNTGGAKAAIFADPGLTAAQANPLTSDGHGNCLYYAPPGTYSHVLSGAVLPVEDVTVIGGGGLSAAEARATYVASADGVNFTWGGNPVSLGSGGGGGVAESLEALFSRQGSISGVLTGTLRFPIRSAGTITDLSVTLGTAPGTNPVTVDFLVNGVVVGTVSVAVGANLGTATVSHAVVAGDYVTVNVTQGDANAADMVARAAA